MDFPTLCELSELNELNVFGGSGVGFTCFRAPKPIPPPLHEACMDFLNSVSPGPYTCEIQLFDAPWASDLPEVGI